MEATGGVTLVSGGRCSRNPSAPIMIIDEGTNCDARTHTVVAWQRAASALSADMMDDPSYGRHRRACRATSHHVCKPGSDN